MLILKSFRRRSSRFRSSGDAKRSELARLDRDLDRVLANTAPPPRVNKKTHRGVK
jgi:hypothetical protein